MNKFSWKKRGLVYELDRSQATLATVPTPYLKDADAIRVFFALCDLDKVGRPYYVDVDAHDPTRIVGSSNRPILSDSLAYPSDTPKFDAHGAVPTSVVTLDDGTLLMYYAGYQRGTDVRYRIFTGAALSRDGGASFTRVQDRPILRPSEHESVLRSSSFVMRDGARFRMWYAAGSTWQIVNGKEVPRYVLKHLESDDGITWPNEGTLSMDLGPDEHGFGRPWVVRDSNGYHLFYSIRRCSLAAYRLGYADSKNGMQWDRKDEQMGLELTPGSFDSRGMSYTAPITVHGRTFCFYNGNDFGADGFAVAELISATG